MRRRRTEDSIVKSENAKLPWFEMKQVPFTALKVFTSAHVINFPKEKRNVPSPERSAAQLLSGRVWGAPDARGERCPEARRVAPSAETTHTLPPRAQGRFHMGGRRN